MSNWKKLRRSVYETGQTILMFMFENKIFKWKTECILNRTNNFNAWIERPAYERGHTRSMLKKEKEKKMPTYVKGKQCWLNSPLWCAFEDEITDFLWSKANTAESLWDFQIFGFKKNTMFFRNLCCFRFQCVSSITTVVFKN